MKSLSYAERLELGKSLRQKVPRVEHASWDPTSDRRDPIEILEQSNQGRVPELTPIRFGRMLRSPFAFLRGAPAMMASDLSGTPATDVTVQASGDCHLVNFGLFATPERNLVFDINDFDESLRATWEWDLKRLAASFVVAGRTSGLSEANCGEAAERAARSYRQHLREFSTMSPLEIWYFQVNAQYLIDSAPDAKSRERREQMTAKARTRVGERLLPKITEQVEGHYRFVENPPIVERYTTDNQRELIWGGIDGYRQSLSEERRFAFDRYRLEDFARRVVGVGSVGTRCYVALLVCDDHNPLFLQIKEARQSVLEPYAEKTPFANQGQRVVVGQRMIQAASDIFLGWLRGGDGHDYYVRQMRDMKFTMPVEELDSANFAQYAEICGWTLARAHAKSGDAATISGYLGNSDKFDAAIRQFAVAYADQTEADYHALEEARRAGRIEVCEEHM